MAREGPLIEKFRRRQNVPTYLQLIGAASFWRMPSCLRRVNPTSVVSNSPMAKKTSRLSAPLLRRENLPARRQDVSRMPPDVVESLRN
jgi:hypothetical protein